MFNFNDIAMYTGLNSGFNYSRISYNSPEYTAARSFAMEAYPNMVYKALTTTDVAIPVQGTTGGSSLRVQFLYGLLPTVSYSESDAMLMKRIPIEKVYSPTFEWTTFNQYGGPGSGFVPEKGTDGNFGINATDDSFQRNVATLRFLAAQRFISLPAQLARNIEDIEAVEQRGAAMEILGKANIASYFADSTLDNNQWNGIIAQLRQWVNQFPNDYGIMYDAGGSPLTPSLLEDVAYLMVNKFGRGSLLMLSAQTYADAMKNLFPNTRYVPGDTNWMGVQPNKFAGPQGMIELCYDPLLRSNRPLATEGPGSTGAPRTSQTADLNAVNWTGTGPYASVSAIASGTGYFWQNRSSNTDTAPLTNPPNVPAADPSGLGGNNGNRLVAGTYYYAVAPVYNGLEGAAWVYGATSAGTVTGATGVAVSAGQIVSLQLNLTSGTLTANYNSNALYVRVYRYGGPNAPAPTSLSQFQYLMDIGNPITSGSTVAYGYDNGMYIPGTDNAFLITETRNGTKGWFMAELLPLMRRIGLPSFAMGDPLVMLWFATPILLIPRHHIWIRNIGRLQ